jgi:hypothetical protein
LEQEKEEYGLEHSQRALPNRGNRYQPGVEAIKEQDKGDQNQKRDQETDEKLFAGSAIFKTFIPKAQMTPYEIAQSRFAPKSVKSQGWKIQQDVDEQ